MAKFQLADMLKDVSDLNTGREQIVYIDPDKLLPDPDNFYSLEGLEDLAANIELVGLQQPPRVRPNADDSYTIVSGHRRRAAIQMIRDGGSDQFANGVPCIVELQESGSKAWQELRLIFANSATRVMTPADLSKQAERVTELLYQLKQEGVEFPGRMRAHVAAACQVSESKLARLHAIRSSLVADLLEHFDAGDLRESTAYALAKLPAEAQRECVKIHLSKQKNPDDGLKYLYEWIVRDFGADIEKLSAQRCPKALTDCCPEISTIISRRYADGKRFECMSCCSKCPWLADCTRACSYFSEKAGQLRAEKKTARKNEKIMQKNADALKVGEIEMYWRRFGNALRAAGLTHRDLPQKMGLREMRGFEIDHSVFNWLFSDKDAELLEDGCFTKTKPDTRLPYGWDMSVENARNLCNMSGALGVSLDYLFCLTDDPHGGSGLVQDTDDVDYVRHEWELWCDPPINAPGWYAVKVQIAETDVIVRKVLWWDECWFLNNRPDASLLDETNKVVGWFPLPDDSEED